MRIYTLAPTDYDYSYMRQIGEHITESGEVWRILETDDDMRATHYQIPRYGSGLYAVCRSREEFRDRTGENDPTL